ncbi:hypothetical protein [Pontiella agarivorans]|uniref:Uncharacterized protein n=1 Tax=Pontiella agarivorans TaxID=3038953 RepID=A0ABU5N0B7_9BACT|nr:hypothetical protein [Pontiella agarivorans]MDZ8119879.1 hypothetical protein [Pontiella agarivorans]
MALFNVQAQWVTETYELKQGWNAVFLHIDPSHVSIPELLDRDINSPITQIWRWNAPSTGNFYEDPFEYTQVATGWKQWIVSDPFKGLQTMVGGMAYLVETGSDYSWAIKGRPVVPAYDWNVDGLNLFGFPTDKTSPATFEDYFNASAELQATDYTFYSYNGIQLDSTNPKKIHPFLYRNEALNRGQAYWMSGGETFNRYFGPFEVDLSGREGLNYRDSGSALSLRIRNMSGQPVTVQMDLLPSENPPAGEPMIDGLPQLLVRGPTDPETLTAGFEILIPGAGNGSQWTLAEKDEEGSEIEVVLGLDRAAITDPPGSLLAGILNFSDSGGMLDIHVPIQADVSSDAGLWVGQALVTEVGQYLKTYAAGSTDPLIVTNADLVVTNDLQISEEGSYIVDSVNRNIESVARPYPLRLIVHSPESGNALLMQQVYFGVDAFSRPVITREESVLDPEKYDQARRVTAIHLPWSEENPGWLFDGTLERGGAISARIITAFNDQRSNPFLHTYHPDHDNLDSRFKQELGQGAESYTIEREIMLNVAPPGTNFSDRVQAHQQLTGSYQEVIRVMGLPRAGGTNDTQIFEVHGLFSMGRVSEISEITDPL